MVEQVKLAWRLLEITALALPALAILVQVLLSMGDDEYPRILHRYSISTISMLLIAPLSVTAIVSIGVILASYQVEWLALAAIPMGVSFLFLPLFLLLRWKERRRLFENVFLEKEKDAIREEIKDGDMSADEAEGELDRIHSHQRSLLWNFRNPEKSIVIKRINRILAVGSLIFAVSLFFNAEGVGYRGLAVFVVITSSVSLSGWSWIETAISLLEE